MKAIEQSKPIQVTIERDEYVKYINIVSTGLYLHINALKTDEFIYGERLTELVDMLQIFELGINSSIKNTVIEANYDNAIGTLFCYLNLNEEGLNYHLKAFDIYNEAYEEDHINKAFTYNKIGHANSKLGKQDSGLDFHNKALDIYKKLLGENHPDVSYTYTCIGDIYCLQENFEKGLEFHQKALSILLSIFADEPHRDLCVIYKKISIDLKKLNKVKESDDFAQKANLIIQRIKQNT